MSYEDDDKLFDSDDEDEVPAPPPENEAPSICVSKYNLLKMLKFIE
jgi:hypothetical protein